jgi:hypothetical protein
MNENEIRQALNVLIMITGNCPYECGFGLDKDNICQAENCVDCWKIILSKELKKFKD